MRPGLLRQLQWAFWLPHAARSGGRAGYHQVTHRHVDNEQSASFEQRGFLDIRAMAAFELPSTQAFTYDDNQSLVAPGIHRTGAAISEDLKKLYYLLALFSGNTINNISKEARR